MADFVFEILEKLVGSIFREQLIKLGLRLLAIAISTPLIIAKAACAPSTFCENVVAGYRTVLAWC